MLRRMRHPHSIRTPPDPSGRPMTQQTFLFVDAPTGTPTVAQIADRFRQTLVAYDGEVLATIGPTVMLRLTRATDAVQLALHHAHHEDGRLRIGFNTGTALRADGHWAGPVVELAARVANHAQPGDVLTTAATRQATDHGTIDFTDAGTPPPRRRTTRPALPTPTRHPTQLRLSPRARRAGRTHQRQTTITDSRHPATKVTPPRPSFARS